jgi:membrane protease YdiL (CAAX protease family)
VTGTPDELTEPQRRGLRIEIVVVLALTFGLSAYTALLQLIEAVLLGLAGRRVALNPRRSPFDLIDLGLNLAVAFQLVAWGFLAVYLLWRSGFGPREIGLGRLRWKPDLIGGLGLAALIGVYDTWWRIPVLVITAFANGWAEEVIVVAFLLTRLRQLRVNPVAALLASGLLRGAYHLYQGFSAGLGNVVMGLVFAYVWRRTGRLWPLVIAHGVIDSVAYVGYALAAGHLGWLS